MTRALQLVLIVVAVALALHAGRVRAQDQADLQGRMFVVATEKLQGPYRGTVMLATDFMGGHIGVILNRPSSTTVFEAFPHFEPAKAVKEPIYFGGPEEDTALLALTRSATAPSPRAVELAAGVWLVFDKVIIDAIIEARPLEARYFVGFVLWRPGELAAEIRDSKFRVRAVQPGKIFLPDTSNLWQDLAPPNARGMRGVKLGS
jgi:putative transcriptional regulator